MSNLPMPDIVNTSTSQEEGKIYLPCVVSSVNSSNSTTVNTTVVKPTKADTDIKLKKNSFRLDLQPIIHENQFPTKLSPDSKNLLSLINGSTPIHLSPAADLEKLFPSGSIFLTGSARNTPTTPNEISFLLSNSEVTEESKEFADSFTAAYSSLLQQETQKEEPGNTSHLIDISQSFVPPHGSSLTLTPTGNNQGNASRVYILAPQQIQQDGLNSLASNGQLTVSVPQQLPNMASGQPVPHTESATSVLISGVTASQPRTITDFQPNGVIGINRRPPTSHAPVSSPVITEPPSCPMNESPSLDSKHSDVESTNSSADMRSVAGGEMTKLERKRARNRDAARRCRDRKMHKIVSLEQKVKQLNDENKKLKSKQCEQREQLVKLKALALEHLKRGCRFEIDLTRVDAALNNPLKKEPDAMNYDDN